MIDLMQAMSGAGKNEDHISAARNVWKALDDMAEADPEQYDKFIQQQMNQAQDLGLKKPASQPGVVLTVFVESTSSITAAVISLFEQEECPQPSEAGKPWNPSSVQLPNMRVKFRARKEPFSVKASDGERCVFELDTHPSVIRHMCMNEPDGFRIHVVERACRHVEKLSGMRLSRQRRTLKVLSEYADTDECRAAVEKKAAAAAVEAAKGTALEGCNELLAELGSLSTQAVGKEHGTSTSSESLLGEKSGRKVTGKPLIEELGGSLAEPTREADESVTSAKSKSETCDNGGMATVTTTATGINVEVIVPSGNPDDVEVMQYGSKIIVQGPVGILEEIDGSGCDLQRVKMLQFGGGEQPEGVASQEEGFCAFPLRQRHVAGLPTL